MLTPGKQMHLWILQTYLYYVYQVKITKLCKVVNLKSPQILAELQQQQQQ